MRRQTKSVPLFVVAPGSENSMFRYFFTLFAATFLGASAADNPKGAARIGCGCCAAILVVLVVLLVGVGIWSMVTGNRGY